MSTPYEEIFYKLRGLSTKCEVPIHHPALAAASRVVNRASHTIAMQSLRRCNGVDRGDGKGRQWTESDEAHATTMEAQSIAEIQLAFLSLYGHEHKFEILLQGDPRGAPVEVIHNGTFVAYLGRPI